ncbi:MAG TPA: hypothetical protein VFE86_17150 [Ilumatobacteraceae bacterium]|nr:hypothetical protein [Ilumatobacteraceae bacterium]
MAADDLPTRVTGAVRRAFEPDDGLRTFELDAPIAYTGYRLDGCVFAWTTEDERGLAWSMIVDLSGPEPAMTGLLVGSETQARTNAELAFRAAVQLVDAEEDEDRRVS